MVFVIKGNNYAFAKRFSKSFLNLVGILTIGFIAYSLFYGLNQKSLFAYLLLLALGGIYCTFVARNILYRVGFAMDTKTVEIEVLDFNSVKIRSSIKFDDIKVTVRKNFLSRYPIWVLTIYDRNKAIYKQKEWPGWSYEDFLRIEEFSKSIK